LCQGLCGAADQQGVALALVPRTPDLAAAYERAGFLPLGASGGLMVRAPNTTMVNGQGTRDNFTESIDFK
jgi:hypothetical protein